MKKPKAKKQPTHQEYWIARATSLTIPAIKRKQIVDRIMDKVAAEAKKKEEAANA